MTNKNSKNQKRNIIVTGAGSGIGLEIVKILEQQGNNVLAILRDARKIKSFKGLKIKSFIADLSNEGEVVKIFKEILEKVKRIDVLINCAGKGYYDFIEKLTARNYVSLYQDNCLSTVLPTKEAFKIMKKQKHGHILSVISVAGKNGLIKESAYNAAKFAQRGFMESLKAEAKGTGIKITSVYPGGINTPFWKNPGNIDLNLSSLMSSKEVAEAIVDLIKPYKTLYLDEIDIKRVTK